MGIGGAAVRVAVVGLLSITGVVRANTIISNPNIAPQTLDGWLSFGTAGGPLHIPPQMIALPDVSGPDLVRSGNPGNQKHTVYFNTTFGPGTFEILFDLAVHGISAANPYAGYAELLIDQQLYGHYDFGDVRPGQFFYGQISATVLGGAPHLLELVFSRPTDGKDIPHKYFFNFSVSQASTNPVTNTPEPSTIALFSLGSALLALRGRLPFGRRGRSRDLAGR